MVVFLLTNIASFVLLFFYFKVVYKVSSIGLQGKEILFGSLYFQVPMLFSILTDYLEEFHNTLMYWLLFFLIVLVLGGALMGGKARFGVLLCSWIWINIVAVTGSIYNVRRRPRDISARNTSGWLTVNIISSFVMVLFYLSMFGY